MHVHFDLLAGRLPCPMRQWRTSCGWSTESTSSRDEASLQDTTQVTFSLHLLSTKLAEFRQTVHGEINYVFIQARQHNEKSKTVVAYVQYLQALCDMAAHEVGYKGIVVIQSEAHPAHQSRHGPLNVRPKINLKIGYAQYWCNTCIWCVSLFCSIVHVSHCHGNIPQKLGTYIRTVIIPSLTDACANRGLTKIFEARVRMFPFAVNHPLFATRSWF